MKKIILIGMVISTIFLSSCSQNTTINQSSTAQNTTQNTEVSGGNTLKLVQGTHNSTQTEATEHVKKILKENPDIGEVGMLNLNYMDSTIDDGTNVYGIFLVSNRTEEVLDKSFEFTISWSYDGTVIYDKGKILYAPIEYGVLTPNSAAIIFLPIPSDKVEFIDAMLDNDKMVLTLSDFSYVE